MFSNSMDIDMDIASYLLFDQLIKRLMCVCLTRIVFQNFDTFHSSQLSQNNQIMHTIQTKMLDLKYFLMYLAENSCAFFLTHIKII